MHCTASLLGWPLGSARFDDKSLAIVQSGAELLGFVGHARSLETGRLNPSWSELDFTHPCLVSAVLDVLQEGLA